MIFMAFMFCALGTRAPSCPAKARYSTSEGAEGLMRRQFGTLTVLLAAATSVAVGAGQQKPTPQQIPVLRSTVDIVSTDVVVRDARGQFIPGLTVKDFAVFEDGVQQKILAFTATLGGRIVADIAPVPEPVASEGIVLPRSNRTPLAPGRIFIIFIDDLHVQGSDTSMMRQILGWIRDTVLHEEDLVGIVSSGYSSIAFDVAPDPQHRRFNAAIEKAMGSAMSYVDVIHGAQTIEGPSGLRPMTYTALRTAAEILDQMEKVTNRRKAFIYVSSGYDFNPLTDSRYKALMDNYGRASSPDDLATNRNPFERGHQQFADSDMYMALGEVIRRAQRANVTFYPVDPRGLVAGPPAGLNLSDNEWAKMVNTSLSSLDTLAGETGGFAVTRTNGFKEAFQKIDNDMSDYYMVGYQSSNPDPTKISRRIEVKVKRPGATVTTHKASYMLKKR